MNQYISAQEHTSEGAASLKQEGTWKSHTAPAHTLNPGWYEEKSSSTDGVMLNNLTKSPDHSRITSMIFFSPNCDTLFKQNLSPKYPKPTQVDTSCCCRSERGGRGSTLHTALTPEASEKDLREGSSWGWRSCMSPHHHFGARTWGLSGTQIIEMIQTPWWPEWCVLAFSQ